MREIGYEVEITQITPGTLSGSFVINRINDIAFLHIASNQSLLYFGSYRPQYITLAFDEGINREHSRVQGEVLPLHAIAGYGLNKTEVFYSSSAGSSMYFVLIPSIFFQGFVHQLSGDRVLQLLNETNQLRVESNHLVHLRNVCRGFLLAPSEPACPSATMHDLMALIHDIMTINYTPKKSKKSSNHRLAREFMRLVFSEALEKPVTITDFSQMLFTAKTAISTQIRQATGLTPMTFLRHARLEQVRSALIKSEGQAAIGDIAKRYGFTSRSHFARHYQNLFGEQPTTTLSRY